jgi:hypothetical protein
LVAANLGVGSAFFSRSPAVLLLDNLDGGFAFSQSLLSS